MNTLPRQRAMMALIGALAGAAVYGLILLRLDEVLSAGQAFFALTLAGVFFTGILGLIGPFSPGQAAGRALLLALVVAGLFFWAATRYDDPTSLLFDIPALVALGVLTLVPLPFLIAEEQAGWRDYPALFASAWALVMRSTVAWVFVAILWAVIFLSDALLSQAGIGVVAQIILYPPAPWLITGTALGLAMAVALELSDVVSADLVLRLLRLLVPVVLVVLAVFLVAVALRGPAALSSRFSLTAILLVMAGVGATLVTSAVDQSDFYAVGSRPMRATARALAAILILPALLAAWALWLRVGAHGWTPDRIFAGAVTALGLGYGVLYLGGSLWGASWMARIRQANIVLALALMALSALWLTPVLNPQGIAAKSQLARYQAGQTALADLDLLAFDRWGRAGAAARAALDDLAKSDAALAARLAAAKADAPATPDAPLDPEALLTALRADMAVTPRLATTYRDRILDLAAPEDLAAWQAACGSPLPQGGPGCVMVVADFLPDHDGDEALLILHSKDGYLTYLGMMVDDTGLHVLTVDSGDDGFINFAEGEKLIAELQAAAPALRPINRNEIVPGIGAGLSLKP